MQQSAYNSCEYEITQLKTNISMQLKNAARDYEKLKDDSATKHDKKRLLASIELKIKV